MEWIPITSNTPLPKLPCLLCDEYGEVFVGDLARDFFDSMKYWCPLPAFPFPQQIIATDEACIALLKEKKDG